VIPTGKTTKHFPPSREKEENSNRGKENEGDPANIRRKRNRRYSQSQHGNRRGESKPVTNMEPTGSPFEKGGEAPVATKQKKKGGTDFRRVILGFLAYAYWLSKKRVKTIWKRKGGSAEKGKKRVAYPLIKSIGTCHDGIDIDGMKKKVPEKKRWNQQKSNREKTSEFENDATEQDGGNLT